MPLHVLLMTRFRRVAAALGAQQKERMRDCFVQASRLEYMFWDMSYAKQAYPL